MCLVEICKRGKEAGVTIGIRKGQARHPFTSTESPKSVVTSWAERSSRQPEEWGTDRGKQGKAKHSFLTLGIQVARTEKV